jgi:hypothetical protein
MTIGIDMRISHKWLLALTLVATVSVVSLAIWHSGQTSRPAMADTNTAPMVVNSVTGDTFTPAPSGSSAAVALDGSGILSEQDAVAAFEAADPAFSPAGPVTYQLGTFDPGPGQDKRPSGEAVWALSWHQCPQSLSPSVTGDISNGVCIEWLFLHADTGQMIVAEPQL